MKVFTVQLKNAVIPAWMLESSHRESVARVLESCYEKLLFIIMRLPSVALDSGIPARMTGLIVEYLKMNIFLGVINTFTISLAIADL
ncbi:MAG: hypothetical protein WCK96_09210 [Methylococcales bacterium]